MTIIGGNEKEGSNLQHGSRRIRNAMIDDAPPTLNFASRSDLLLAHHDSKILYPIGGWVIDHDRDCHFEAQSSLKRPLTGYRNKSWDALIFGARPTLVINITFLRFLRKNATGSLQLNSLSPRP